MQLYDVNFNLRGDACFVIEAKDIHDAISEAKEALDNMDKKEIIRRICDALDFYGVYVDSVAECE